MAEENNKVDGMNEADVKAEYERFLRSKNSDDLTEQEVKTLYALEIERGGPTPTPAPTPGAKAWDVGSWQLPLAGTVIGGLLAGPPGAVGGAILGKTGENIIRGTQAGAPLYPWSEPRAAMQNAQPVSRLEAWAGPPIEGAMGGLGEMAGQGLNYAATDLAKTKAGQTAIKGAKGLYKGALNTVGNALGMSPMEAQFFMGNYPEYLKLAGMSGKEAFQYINALRQKFNEQITKGKGVQNKVLDQVRTEAKQTPININDVAKVRQTLVDFLDNLPKNEVLGNEAKAIQNEIDVIDNAFGPNAANPPTANELIGLQERLRNIAKTEYGKKLGFTSGTASDKASKSAAAASNEALTDLANTFPFLQRRQEANQVLSEMRKSAEPIKKSALKENEPITNVLSMSRETPEGVAARENMSRLNELSGYGPAFSDMLDYSSAANAKKAYDAFGAKQYATRALLGAGAGAATGGYTGRDGGMRNASEEAMYLGLLGAGIGSLMNPKLGAMALRNVPRASQWMNYAVPRVGTNLGAQQIKNYLGTNYEGFDYGN